MRMTEISIKDFRGIPDLKLFFDPRITVLVGRNGVGKSSLLDALAILLEPIRSIWPDSNGQKNYTNTQINKEDLRLGASNCCLLLRFMLNSTDGKEYEFQSEKNYTDSIHENKLWMFALNLEYEPEKQPLFVYYRQDRGFENSQRSTNIVNKDIISKSSLFGDIRAISDLETWWDSRDAEEARHVRDTKNYDYRDPQLEAVRMLIREIDNFSGINFRSTASPPGLYLEKGNGVSVHVSKLSSGERSYIILLADLARRLQVMAPEKKLSEISGIVLIDEIELNLHPAWQSQIISTLQKIFHSCQFIITTHSPQVISSIESAHVRMMKILENGDIRVENPLSTKGRSSNYLLEGVFDSPERFPEIDRMIENFNMAIEEDNPIDAKSILSDISEQMEGDPPELLVLRKRLRKIEKQHEG